MLYTHNVSVKIPISNCWPVCKLFNRIVIMPAWVSVKAQQNWLSLWPFPLMCTARMKQGLLEGPTDKRCMCFVLLDLPNLGLSDIVVIPSIDATLATYAQRLITWLGFLVAKLFSKSMLDFTFLASHSAKYFCIVNHSVCLCSHLFWLWAVEPCCKLFNLLQTFWLPRKTVHPAHKPLGLLVNCLANLNHLDQFINHSA